MASPARSRSRPGAKTPDGRVLMLIGDPVVTDARARAAIDQWLPRERQVVDLEIVRVPEHPVDRAIELLSQVGLFGAGRCVWIRLLRSEPKKRTENAEGQKRAEDADGVEAETQAEDAGGAQEILRTNFTEQIERLLAFLEGGEGRSGGLPEGCFLVVTARGIDRRTRLCRWFEGQHAVVDLRIDLKPGEEEAKSPERRENLADFVQNRVRANGLSTVAPSVIQAIAERVGAELGQLAQEIDRLCLACVPGGRIDEELVRTHMMDHARLWVFDLTNALGKRDSRQAQRVLDRLLSQGEPPLRLVATVATRLAALIEMAPYARTLPVEAQQDGRKFLKSHYAALPESVRARFSNPWRLYYLLRDTSAFTRDTLRRLHHELLEVDLRLKSTKIPPALLLSRFIQQACASRV